jgi:EAL domain-containing protein (putative c-di-GMP-specific phosphodiesterase class I)
MSIIRAVIALGKSLRIKVTAEGVESAAQLNLLQQENCDLVQGYLLGRPMAKEDLGKLLTAASAAEPAVVG